MSTSENKTIVHRFIEELWNTGRLEVAAELFRSDCVLHYQGKAFPLPPAAATAIVVAWRAAFPDFQFSVEEMIAEEQTVTVRLVFRGTHQGAFFGVEPAGTPITVSEMLMIHFVDGEISEMWEEYDELGLRQQLSAGTTA